MKLELCFSSIELNLDDDRARLIGSNCDLSKIPECLYALRVSPSVGIKPFAINHMLNTSNPVTKESELWHGVSVIFDTKNNGGFRHLVVEMNAAGVQPGLEPYEHTIGYGNSVIDLKKVCHHHLSGSSEYTQTIDIDDYPSESEDKKWHSSSVSADEIGSRGWKWVIRAKVEVVVRIHEITPVEERLLAESTIMSMTPDMIKTMRQRFYSYMNDCMDTHGSLPVSRGLRHDINTSYVPAYNTEIGVELPSSICMSVMRYSVKSNEHLYLSRLIYYMNIYHIGSDVMLEVLNEITNDILEASRLLDNYDSSNDYSHPTEVKTTAHPVKLKSEVVSLVFEALFIAPLSCLPYVNDENYTHQLRTECIDESLIRESPGVTKYSTTVEQIEPLHTHKYDCEDGTGEENRCFMDLCENYGNSSHPLLRTISRLLSLFNCLSARIDSDPKNNGIHELHISPIFFPKFVTKLWLAKGLADTETHNTERFNHIKNTINSIVDFASHEDNVTYDTKSTRMKLTRTKQISNYLVDKQLSDSQIREYHDYVDSVLNQYEVPLYVLCDATTVSPLVMFSQVKPISATTTSHESKTNEWFDIELVNSVIDANDQSELRGEIILPSTSRSLDTEFYKVLISSSLYNPLFDTVIRHSDIVGELDLGIADYLCFDYVFRFEQGMGVDISKFDSPMDFITSLRSVSLVPLAFMPLETVCLTGVALTALKNIEPLYISVESLESDVPSKSSSSLVQSISEQHQGSNMIRVHIRSMRFDASMIKSFVDDVETRLSTAINSGKISRLVSVQEYKHTSVVFEHEVSRVVSGSTHTLATPAFMPRTLYQEIFIKLYGSVVVPYQILAVDVTTNILTIIRRGVVLGYSRDIMCRFARSMHHMVLSSALDYYNISMSYKLKNQNT